MQDSFLVRPSRKGWNLQWNGRDLDTFAERCRAIRAAVAAARMCERKGRTVEILELDEQGKPSTVVVQ
jgi:hypothetical protein